MEHWLTLKKESFFEIDYNIFIQSEDIWAESIFSESICEKLTQHLPYISIVWL